MQKAMTAKTLKKRPSMGHRDLFIPSLTALLHSHAATVSQYASTSTAQSTLSPPMTA